MTITPHAIDTPNGRKISVARQAMRLPCAGQVVDTTRSAQFDPAFFALGPDSKIALITDPDGAGGRVRPAASRCR